MLQTQYLLRLRIVHELKAGYGQFDPRLITLQYPTAPQTDAHRQPD